MSSAILDMAAERPITALLLVVGVVVGLWMPSGLDILNELVKADITKSPEAIIFGIPIIFFVEVLSGLLGGILGALLGLLIESLNGTEL